MSAHYTSHPARPVTRWHVRPTAARPTGLRRVMIVERGDWTVPVISGKCEVDGCRGIMRGGQCPVCGFARMCAWCRYVKVNGVYTKKWIRQSRNVSHGICPSCISIYHKEAA